MHKRCYQCKCYFSKPDKMDTYLLGVCSNIRLCIDVEFTTLILLHEDKYTYLICQFWSWHQHHHHIMIKCWWHTWNRRLLLADQSYQCQVHATSLYLEQIIIRTKDSVKLVEISMSVKHFWFFLEFKSVCLLGRKIYLEKQHTCPLVSCPFNYQYLALHEYNIWLTFGTAYFTGFGRKKYVWWCYYSWVVWLWYTIKT